MQTVLYLLHSSENNDIGSFCKQENNKKTIGNIYFTLIEYHEFNAENHTHTIKNKACKSLNNELIGWECSFSEVPEWSGLVGNITFTNVTKPLFSYFRVPSANDIDLDSPLGISVYAHAVDLIRQVDEQLARKAMLEGFSQVTKNRKPAKTSIL